MLHIDNAITKGMMMHTIEIFESADGVFEVLINGVGYAIHRGLDAEGAQKRAAEIKASFKRQGQRSRISVLTA
jgi:hypothetical protein